MNIKTMTKGQTKMKPLIPSIEFVSPLSEVEVRMTLRELCGSSWDNYPFNGIVDRNSFRFKKNNLSNTRGATKPILVGDFVEQNGKTKVTISIQTRVTNILRICILVLGAITLAGFDFVAMLDESFGFAITSAVMIILFCVGILALNYFFIYSSFQRSVAKIKKALGSASL